VFTDYSSPTEKYEAPNHDTGCGSGNNHRASSQQNLHCMRIGQRSILQVRLHMWYLRL